MCGNGGGANCADELELAFPGGERVGGEWLACPIPSPRGTRGSEMDPGRICSRGGKSLGCGYDGLCSVSDGGRVGPDGGAWFCRCV